MPRGDQLSRQWQLLQLIDRPQGITVDDAARDLTVTICTIWRDPDALQKAGFPLYTERAPGGNRGVARAHRRLQARAAAEAHPGRAGRAADEPPSALTAWPGACWAPRSARRSTRIQNVLSRDALKVLDQIRDRLGVRLTGAKLQAPAAEHRPKIHEALAEHRTLRTRYYSASRDREDTRSIDPYHTSSTPTAPSRPLPPARRHPHLAVGRVRIIERLTSPRQIEQNHALMPAKRLLGSHTAAPSSSSEPVRADPSRSVANRPRHHAASAA